MILGTHVEEIPSGLFESTDLEEFIVPDSSCLRSIGDGAFAETLLKAVNLPASVREIGQWAFSDCTKLESVTWHDSIEEIGSRAFEGDSSLASIGRIPYGLKSLGGYAFAECVKLCGNIMIPDGVSRIESSVFDGCLMLKDVSLPSSVTHVAAAAFRNCVNLETLSVYTLEPPEVGRRDAFENLNCTLQVPCMGAAIYRIADGWDYFGDNIEEISPYRLVVESNNDKYGSVQVTTPATCESDIVTVSAVPAPLCHFVCWRDRSGNKLSEANPYVFALTSDLNLIAEFRSDADTVVWYTVGYDPMPEGGRVRVECEGLEVQPGGHLESGSVLSLQAEADAGYRFAAWWDGESAPSREYYLDADLEISATFTPLVSNEGLDKGLCRIWPNPADGRFYVELGRDACLEILSAQGVVVRPAMELDAGCHEVDMSGQAAGLYFLRLTASQESRVFKLLLR